MKNNLLNISSKRDNVITPFLILVFISSIFISFTRNGSANEIDFKKLFEQKEEARFSEALPYCQSASEVTNNDIEAIVNFANASFSSGDLLLALEKFEYALFLALQEDINDSSEIAPFYFDVAMAWFALEHYENSLFFLKRAISAYSDNSSSYKIYVESNIYAALSSIYLKDFPGGLIFIDRAIDIVNDYSPSDQNDILAAAYAIKGEIYYELENYKESIIYYNKSANLLVENNSSFEFDKGKVYEALGLVFKETKNFEKSLDALLKSLDFYSEKEDFKKQLKLYTIIGELFLEGNRYRKAQEHFNHALNLATGIYGSTSREVREILKLIAVSQNKERALACYDSVFFNYALPANNEIERDAAKMKLDLCKKTYNFMN
jgi:tetratricopeptide (TPR) repeat protein